MGPEDHDDAAADPTFVATSETSSSDTQSEGEGDHAPRKQKRPRLTSKDDGAVRKTPSLRDWNPPSDWTIQRGFLWCPKAGRGFTRRALALHVRECDSCPLKLQRKELSDVQTWAAPRAEDEVTCACDTVIRRTAKYGLRKCVQRHIKNVRAHRGANVSAEANKVLNSAYRTVSVSKRTAEATGLPRVLTTKLTTKRVESDESDASTASAASRSPDASDRNAGDDAVTVETGRGGQKSVPLTGKLAPDLQRQTPKIRMSCRAGPCQIYPADRTVHLTHDHQHHVRQHAGGDAP